MAKLSWLLLTHCKYFMKCYVYIMLYTKDPCIHHYVGILQIGLHIYTRHAIKSKKLGVIKNVEFKMENMKLNPYCQLIPTCCNIFARN